MIYLIVIVLFAYTLYRFHVIEQKIANNKNPQERQSVSTPVPSESNTFAQPAERVQTPVPNSQPVVIATEANTFETPAASTAEIAKANSATEFNLGSRVFTGIGVVAILLGVGFFLRYAFANDLISQGARIFIGIIFGLILAGIGHWLKSKYQTYGYTLVGAGFGVLYLSVYAAYSFYHLIDPTTAFGLLILITAASVTLAIQYNSKPLIGYSFFGAFLMPFMLPFGTDMNTLFIYLIIVNAGALLVARFKVWPILTVGALGGTSLIYIKWILGSYTDVQFFPTLAYCTVIFLSYFTTSLLNFVYRDRNYEGIDALLLYATPIVYFVLNIYIMKGADNTALLAAVIGIFNFVMFAVIRFSFGDIGQLKKFSEGIFLMAAVFIATAIGLHFSGSSVTLSWAIEAMAMALVGYSMRSKANMMAGLVFSILVGLKMLIYGLSLPLSAVAIFNGRSATLILVAIMFAVVWSVFHLDLIKNTRVIKNAEESDTSKYLAVIGFFGTIFLWISVEAHDFLPNYTLYLPIFWLIYATIMTSISFFIKEKLSRFLSYALVILAFFVILVNQWHLDPTLHPLIFNIRVLTALVFAAVGVAFVKFINMHPDQVGEGEKQMKTVFLLGANLIVLWAATLEVFSYFDQQMIGQGGDQIISIENTKRVSLSIFWLLYALAGLAVGILQRSLFARYFSIALFGITIFKILLYDTANLSDVYRFVSYIVLGVILLIVGFSYYRFKDRITAFVTEAK